MISFRNVFLESFIHNKPFNFNRKELPDGNEYIFNIGRRKHSCIFSKMNISKDVINKFGLSGGVYLFVFGNKTKDGINYDLTKNIKYTNVRRLFATIEEIFVDFLETKNPDAIHFTASAEEPTRVRFYKFLLRRLQKEHNYQYLSKDGASILFNPEMDEDTADKIIKFAKYNDNDIVNSREVDGVIVDEDGNDKIYSYRGSKVSVKELYKKYPNTTGYTYNKQYILNILKVNSNEREATGEIEKIWKSIEHKYRFIVIDVKKNDPYFRFYRFFSILGGHNMIRDTYSEDDDRVIYYIHW